MFCKSFLGLAIAVLGCPARSASPDRTPVRLVVRDTFHHGDTLILSTAALDSACAGHPYLLADSLARLDPDTAWARHQRSDSGERSQACENDQDDFFRMGALSLSRKHVGMESERSRMQDALYELDALLSCLDGGGTGHVHQVSRIPLRAEHALEQAIQTGFQASRPLGRKDLKSWIQIARPDRTEDPDAPETHLEHCLKRQRYRLPKTPWIREQTAKVLDRF